MRKIILFLLFVNFIACRQKPKVTEKETEKKETTTQQELSYPPKEISFDDLEEVSLPFCLKKVEKDVSYHYYDDIDFFLSYYK